MWIVYRAAEKAGDSFVDSFYTQKEGLNREVVY